MPLIQFETIPNLAKTKHRPSWDSSFETWVRWPASVCFCPLKFATESKFQVWCDIITLIQLFQICFLWFWKESVDLLEIAFANLCILHSLLNIKWSAYRVMCSILTNASKGKIKCYNSKCWKKTFKPVYMKEVRILVFSVFVCHGILFLILFLQMYLPSVLLLYKWFRWMVLPCRSLPVSVFPFCKKKKIISVYSFLCGNHPNWPLMFKGFPDISQRVLLDAFNILKDLDKKREYIQLKQEKNSWTQPCIQEK